MHPFSTANQVNLQTGETNMSKVIFSNSVSLDGFVAGPNDNPDNGLGDGGQRLFEWYMNGDTELPLPGTEMVFKLSRASAEMLQKEWANIGAMVAGRRMFDIAHAWGGNPPGGENCFIVTHKAPQEWVKPGSPFIFVTDGVESAVRQAKQAAGDKNVGISSASIAQQCIKAGLLDEIHLDLVPVLLGGGVRLFDNLGETPPELELMRVLEGLGVTHLKYRVIR
jgi:dihydrofolate reductase